MDYADSLRALAATLVAEQTTLSGQASNLVDFIDRVEAKIGVEAPSGALPLLTYVFTRHKSMTEEEVLRLLEWVSTDPALFYWGPYFPLSPPT